MIPTKSIETKINRDNQESDDFFDIYGEKIVNKIQEELNRNGIKGKVYYIVNNGIEVHITKEDESKKKIPFKIVNGRLVVPDEYKKYLSNDGKSLNFNDDSVIKKILNNIKL